MSLEDGAKSLRKNSEETAENDQAAANGDSRFSEDDVDTEIEVAPEENSEKKTRRKKEKKSEKEKSTDDKEKKKTKGEKAGSTSTYPHDDEGEKNKKKRNLKNEVNNLVNTPFILVAGVLICVILPFSIYACDVIISVNVIDSDNYRNAIVYEKNNMSQLPYPQHLIGEKYHIPDTLFHIIQINSKPKKHVHSKSRRTRQVSDNKPILVESATDLPPVSANSTKAAQLGGVVEQSANQTLTAANVTDVATTVASPTAMSANNTSSTFQPVVDSNSTADVNATFSTTTLKPRNTTPKKSEKFKPRPGFRFTTLKTTTTEEPEPISIDPELWKRQPNEYCYGLYYFYDLHIRYAKEHESDWFQDQTTTVYQKEQALFFLFTIIGFIFLLIGLGLRCDVFLSDEWSSFILVNLFLYSISMAVTVSIFAQESAKGGLRCATCRFTVYCSDIDPWDYHNHWPADYDDNWPTHTGTVKWSLVALLSFILKLIDCVAIAIVTLKFILDVASDLWWITCLKVFGWLFVFPILIFTPMLGVVRYEALPMVAPDDAASMLAVEVFFYIGIVFWAILLVVTPFFCRMKMCSGSEDENTQEEEDEEY